MLKKRLIPKLQMKMGTVAGRQKMVLVTTINFDKVVEIGDPVSQAKIYQAQAADELIFVDIDASAESRGTVADVISKLSEEVFMPITVGGGVRTLEDYRTLLNCGADKISVNSSIVENPSFINEASQRFGAQCVVASIDFKRNYDRSFSIWTHGGSKKVDKNPIDWAVECEERGAGEILLTSIDRDGTRQGLDIEICKEITEKLSVPVIVSGGCGLARHFVEGYQQIKCNAISAGTYFCFKDENPMQTRSQIRNAGLPIRLHT
jgi:cyclase